MNPILYRWTDGNAPVARGRKECLVEILTKCLVTGYGDKPGAGWTREYFNVEETRAVFRNDPVAGTGFYLMVDGENFYNSETTPYVMAYEASLSLDDHQFPFIPPSILTTSRSAMYTSNQVNDDARPWILIADNRFFYLFIWVTSSTATYNPGPIPVLSYQDLYCSSLCFGDFIPYYPDDTSYNCCFLPTGSTYGTGIGALNVAAASPVGTLQRHPVCPRNINGDLNSAYVASMITTNPFHYTSGPVVGAYEKGLAWVEEDPFMYARPFLMQDVEYSIRGYLPGLYEGIQLHRAKNHVFIESEGKTFYSFACKVFSNQYSNYNAVFLISLDDWWI